jgi:hypothetical protein
MSSSVPEATVLGENSNLIVDEELLEKAKCAADEELARQRRNLESKHDNELERLKARHDAELKVIQKELDTAEANSKLAQQVVYEATKAAKDVAHRQTMQSLRDEAESNRRAHENTMKRLIAEEETTHSTWMMSQPRAAVQIFERRNAELETHKNVKKSLIKSIEEDTAIAAKLYKTTESDWWTTVNDLNSKHWRNMLVGMALGGLLGFVVDHARM